MTTTHTFHNFNLNAREIIIIQGYDPYVSIFCDSDTNRIHAYLVDPETDYREGTYTEVGRTLYFHIVYKKVAIWVRVERPSLDDRLTINFFATKKPIGAYSSKVPAIVREENAVYHDGCKHYANNCPYQPVACALDFSFSGNTPRERLICDWRRCDEHGWQGMLGDPEEIYPTTP